VIAILIAQKYAWKEYDCIDRSRALFRLIYAGLSSTTE
jgi:hypothetical protein